MNNGKTNKRAINSKATERGKRSTTTDRGVYKPQRLGDRDYGAGQRAPRLRDGFGEFEE